MRNPKISNIIALVVTFVAENKVEPLADREQDDQTASNEHRLAVTAFKRLANEAPALLEELRPFDDKPVVDLALHVQQVARAKAPGMGIAKEATPPRLREWEPVDRCELIEAWIFAQPENDTVRKKAELAELEARIVKLRAEIGG
jgi:hypothetical protein